MRVTGVGRWLDEALAKVFLTEYEIDEQLSYIREWMGKPCNCPGKRSKVNRLWRWAQRINDGRIADAEKYLDELLTEELT